MTLEGIEANNVNTKETMANFSRAIHVCHLIITSVTHQNVATFVIDKMIYGKIRVPSFDKDL